MPQFSHLYSSALNVELGTADSTRLFTDARRKSAINHGLQQFADLTECFIRQSTIACSTGTREYNLLSTTVIPGGDYLRLAKQGPEYHLSDSAGNVSYVTGENFPRREIAWLNQYQQGWRDSSAGTPSAYYERMDGGRRFFGLDAPPDLGSSETASILLSYVAKPQTLTSDTDVPFTIASTAAGPSTGVRTDLEPYHQAAVHYAAHELEKLRLNYEASQSQMQIFLGYCQRFVQTMRPKGGQQVKTGRSYFAESRRGRYESDGPLAWPW